MKIAVVRSRKITQINLSEYLDSSCTEIVSGGARGVDECARAYACENAIKLQLFLPEYVKYGRGAPILRNRSIVDYSDKVLIFWDGSSKGTKWVIDYCRRTNREYELYVIEQ